MTEEFLSHIWKYKLYKTPDIRWEGEVVEIIFPGELNTDAGPDFTNAKIKIGSTIWVGNVEIHCNASDWYKHNHDKNAAFDNVILHVVAKNDNQVITSKGRNVPTLELNYDSKYWLNYAELQNGNAWIPCKEKLPRIDSFTITSWISTLAIERLSDKTAFMEENLVSSISNWEEIFYRQLARSFGFHVNALPFELLSNNLSYKILQKHANNLLQTESLLFGTAGFLMDDYSTDDYFKKLKSEYTFLSTKYTLKPIDPHVWKFMRLRPGNFPVIRIAQFAALIYASTTILTDIIKAESVNEILKMLTQPLSSYWENHYSFHHESKTISKTIGEDSAHNIIINTIIPFLFIYGRHLGKPKLEDRALQFLETLPAENNAIIKKWKECGIHPKSAFDTQALLQLKNSYCSNKRCANCRIGIKLISGENI